MPLNSETRTSGGTTTVTVTNPSGTGGGDAVVHVQIIVDTGKVIAYAPPTPGTYASYDPQNLFVLWLDIDIPEDTAPKEFQFIVQRNAGQQYEGPVGVTTVVASDDGAYYKIKRTWISDQGNMVMLDASVFEATGFEIVPGPITRAPTASSSASSTIRRRSKKKSAPAATRKTTRKRTTRRKKGGK